MDRSSRSRDKKDKAYDYPKSAASRFESEYSRSYTKPNAKPYRGDGPYTNLPSPTTSNNAVVKITKPQTPHPSHSSARNYYRSSTAVPSSLHTLNTINKMEQILKKSVGITPNETLAQSFSKEASARSSAQSTAKHSGHMNQMYGMKGSGISGTTPRSGDHCPKLREGDNTWSANVPKTYDKMIEEAQAQEKQFMIKEEQRRKGQGDNTKGSIKNPSRPILTKPRSSINNPMTHRWSTDNQTGSVAKCQKKVRFNDNITTHQVPYEERGSYEWRKNILAMNMNYRSYMGFPNLRNLPMPMPLSDSVYKNNRPATGYDPSLIMSMMMPSTQSRPMGNDWNKGLRDNYGSANSALCEDYQVEPDLNRHFDSGLKNTKPKSPYYNFPTPRRR